MVHNFDRNRDGKVTVEELAISREQLKLDNEDRKQDAQRHMVWYALGGMLTYPLILVLSEWAGFESSMSVIGSFASTYFVSVSAIVAAYFAKEGYIGRIDRTNINVSNHHENIKESVDDGEH